MNPILAIAEILVSIGLIAAILLQSRGAGLGATFGGESSAYRSRRGVEKTLFQFTLVLVGPVRGGLPRRLHHGAFHDPVAGAREGRQGASDRPQARLVLPSTLARGSRGARDGRAEVAE